MRARFTLLLLAFPLLAPALAGCDVASALLVPAAGGSGGGLVSGGNGLAITRLDVDPSQRQVAAGETRRLAVEANRTGVAFNWTATGGSLSPSGASAVWTAPAQKGTYRVDVTARLGSDEADGSFQFTVQ